MRSVISYHIGAGRLRGRRDLPGVAGGGTVLPTDYANLVCWYDATDITTLWQDTGGTTQAENGTKVRRWDDLSGNGHHLTRSAGLDSATVYNSSGFGANSLAQVDFAAQTSGYLDSIGGNFGLAAEDEATLIMLLDSDEPAADFSYVFGMTSPALGVFYESDVFGADGPGYNDGGHVSFGVGSAVDTASALAVVYTGTDSSLYSKTSLLSASGVKATFDTGGTAPLRMGVSGVVSDFKVCKLAFYDGTLATADWQALATQWSDDAGFP